MIRARRMSRQAALRAGATAPAWLARLNSDLSAIGPRLIGTLSASGVVAMLGLASGAIAARDLGPASRGELALLLLWPQLFCTIGNLGVDLASTYLSADPLRRTRLPATLVVLAVAQSAVLVPVYLLTMPFVLEGRVVTRDAMLLASLIPLYLIGSYCSGALGGWLNFRAFNAVRIATPLVYTTGVVALAATEKLTAGTAALAFLAANGTADALAALLLWRQAGRGSVDLPLARDAVFYGLRAHIGRLSPQALGVDVIVVALFLSTKDLGLFVAAGAFLAAPRLVTASIGMVVFPHVSAAHLAGERPRLRAMGALYVLAAVVPAVVLLAGAQPAVHLLFGSEYGGAVRVLQLLAVSSLALALRAFPSEVLRGLGRPGLTSIAEVASWAMFLASGALGAWLGGVEGVAAGASVASVLSLAVTCALAYRSGVFAMPGVGRQMEVA